MWNDLWKIVLGVVASVGGVGVVIVAAVKFSVDIIAKRLEEKYTLKMNKELEKYRVGWTTRFISVKLSSILSFQFIGSYQGHFL